MLFLMIIHSIVCVLLVLVILMQAGRGGGLTDSFAAAENMFGTKTNEFMVRATVVLSTIFLITSISLGHLSARRDQSIMERLMDKTKKPDIKINIPLDEKKSEGETPLAESKAEAPAETAAPASQGEPAAAATETK